MPLIGNTHALAVELVPVAPTWELRYQPEAAAWAGIAIWVDGENLSSHVYPGSGQVEEYLYVPLGSVVDWLVRAFPAIEFEERAPVFPTTELAHASVARWGNTSPPAGMDENVWHDQREAWWQRHFLAAGVEGSRLPNIAFVRNDEDLVLDWERPRFVRPGAPTMLYPTGNCQVPWTYARRVLADFASIVAQWLTQAEAEATFEWQSWERPLTQAPMEHAIALFTGRDVSELERIFAVDSYERLIGELDLADQEDPAAAPQCQMLRDLAPRHESDVNAALVEIGESITRHDREALRGWRSMRGSALDMARSADSREQAGQLAAFAVRRGQGLGSQPISDLQEVLGAAGVRHVHLDGVRAQRDRMITGLRENGSPAVGTFDVPRMGERWTQNFEAARALGHLLLDPVRAGAIGAAAGPFAQATRRKRSGAFAAELLLPERAIAEESNYRLDGATGDAQFVRVMEKYGIGARAAAFQMWNRGWLSSEYVRDWLIDEFAATYH